MQKHYFIEDKTTEKETQIIRYTFKEASFSFYTETGIFSKDHVDYASSLLMEKIPPLSGSLLDLGCGYGVIGIVLAKTYGLALTQSDINPAAVRLTEKNCKHNDVKSEVVLSDGFQNPLLDKAFDTIVLNPPIHAGKKVVYTLFEETRSHLNEGGRLYVVTLKKHGAKTTYEKLLSVYGNCEELYKKGGYFIFCAKRTD